MAVTINASTSAGLVTSADTSGNLNIQSNGTTVAAITSSGLNVVGALTVNGSAPLTTKLITDSTDIALNNIATPSYSNVGSSFSIDIPTNGFIRFSSFSGRFLTNATATSHLAYFGIRIGTTNYWFTTYDNNGTITTDILFNLSASANIYRELSGYNFQSISQPVLDVVGASIPSGTQTVQLIAAYGTTQATIKGTTKQTRVILEFVSA